MRRVTFSDSEIANRCREIKTATNSAAHIQGSWDQKFVLAVQLLVNCLMLEAMMAPEASLGTILPD